jgi:predicted ATP-grasp superfamily ATP-dependent carboligase
MTGSDWVLVTDGSAYQTRSTLAAVRALAAGGYRPGVTVCGPGSIAAASRYCARVVQVPEVTEPGYPEAVRDEMQRGGYLTVLPASDSSLLALGAPVERLVDKASAAELARAAGIPVPPTEVFDSWDDLVAGARRMTYPLVLKPAISTFGTVRVGSPEELLTMGTHQGRLLVQPYLTEPLRAVAGVLWGNELVAAVHQRYLRTWPPDCGTASAAETTAPDEGLEDRLTALLSGYEGIFQAQFAGPYLLDLNLRVYGSLPLAVAAGANLPALFCDLLQGRPVRRVRARTGVFYRWIEGDLRHLARGVRSRSITPGQAMAELRPRRGAAHSTESLRDPGPMIARLRYVAGRRG